MIARQYCDMILKSAGTKIEYFHNELPPDSEIVQRMSEALCRALQYTPTKTMMRSRIAAYESGYRMFVVFSFEGGSIFSVGRGTSPQKAIRRTTDDVYSKIRQWRAGLALSQPIQPILVRPDVAVESEESENTKLRNDRDEESLVWRFTPRVLIVDNNPLSVKLIESCLQQLGCQTSVVTRGTDAVREITNNDYDLVVLDWMMPDLNGAQTLAKAQDIISYDANYQRPWVTSQMPVITYSGEERARMRMPNCSSFEIMGHIPKTSTLSQLKQATSGFLNALRPI